MTNEQYYWFVRRQQLLRAYANNLHQMQVAGASEQKKEDPMLPDREGWLNIHNEEEFMQFANNVNDKTLTAVTNVCLCKNLDFKNVQMRPIGGSDVNNDFCGTFDGRGCTLKNVNIYRAHSSVGDNRGVGIFGYTARKIDGAGHSTKIMNLNVENGSVSYETGKDIRGVGMIMGSCNWGADLINCHIKNCNVSGRYCVGGIVGEGYASIDNCSMTDCNVEGSDFGCGAIIGQHSIDAQHYPVEEYGLGGLRKCKVENCTITCLPQYTIDWYLFGGLIGDVAGLSPQNVLLSENHVDATFVYNGQPYYDAPILGALNNDNYEDCPKDPSFFPYIMNDNSWTTRTSPNLYQEIRGWIAGQDDIPRPVTTKTIVNSI